MIVTRSFLLLMSAAFRERQSSKKGTTLAINYVNYSLYPKVTKAICSLACTWVVLLRLSVISYRMYSSSLLTTFKVLMPYYEALKRATYSLVKVWGNLSSLRIHLVILIYASRQARMVRLNEWAFSAPNSPLNFSTNNLRANLSK